MHLMGGGGCLLCIPGCYSEDLAAAQPRPAPLCGHRFLVHVCLGYSGFCEPLSAT